MRRLSRPRGRHPERGATAAEFAWVLPILMAVTLGTLDLGRMVVFKEMCAYAAITGARTALGKYNKATPPTALTISDVQSAASNAVPMLKLTSSNVTVLPTGAAFTNRARGTTVTVTITYTFTPLVPKISKIISTGKPWTISSAMVIP